MVFTSLALISLMIAVMFAALGAWLILPFAGLEAFALYVTFRSEEHTSELQSH